MASVVAVPAVMPADSLRTAGTWALAGVLAAKAVGGWGVQWDIRWHILIGRDSFWIAPHVMTYASVAAVAALSLGILLLGTVTGHGARAGMLRTFGLVGTPGWHLTWWGIALTILAAPIDDLWHRLFGIDVTLWSPPHLLGFAGAQVSTLGCLAVTLELWPADRARRQVALAAGSALLLGTFVVLLDPGVHTAFRRGGAFYFTWAVLAAGVLGFSLVLATRLSGERATPIVLAALVVVLHFAGAAIADAGFALARPTPAIAEAIAADPDSPIAIAHEMARRNATPPGRVLWLRLFPLPAAVVMAWLDARRRPIAAAIGFGLTAMAVSGLMLARLPGLSHALPSTLDVAVGLVLVVVAAAAGAAAGTGLGARLVPSPVIRKLAPA